MSLLEQQKAFARLLTDPEIRKRLLTEPAAVGRELDLQAEEIEDLLEVAESSLGTFAGSLVMKRLNEVSKLLPITRRVAGEEFRQLFLGFAAAYNPRSVKKHYEDAVTFCRFVEEQKVAAIVRDAARFERTRLTFFNDNRHFICCRSRYELERQDSLDGETQMRKRAFLAVWFRIGRRVFHFSI